MNWYAFCLPFMEKGHNTHGGEKVDGSLQLITNFKQFDTATQVFNLVDEITENFQEHFEQTQSLQEKKESAQQKRIRNLKDKKPYETPWENQNNPCSFSDKRNQINKHILSNKDTQKRRGEKALRKNQQLPGKNVSSENTEDLSSKTQKNSASEKPLTSTENIKIDPNEFSKIIENLKSFSLLSHVQDPNYEKISNKLMNTFRGVGKKTGKNVETLKQETSSSNDKTSSSKNSRLNKPSLAAKKNKYANQIENMKNKVLEQMKFQLRLTLKNGMGYAHIRLKPSILGNVKIHLLLESSSATANFAVENNTVKELLQNNENTLKNSLEEKGFEVQNIHVSMEDNESMEEKDERSFSPMEDQKTVKEWIRSFYRYENGLSALNTNEDDDSDSDEDIFVSSEELLNIIA